MIWYSLCLSLLAYHDCRRSWRRIQISRAQDGPTSREASPWTSPPTFPTAHILPRFQIVPYSDFLLFSPERIAPTLRRFQDNDDPERQVIVEAVLDVVQSDEPEQWESHWETFVETGLHKIVVDILCDDRTYAPGVSEVCSPSYSLRHTNLMYFVTRTLGIPSMDIRPPPSVRCLALQEVEPRSRRSYHPHAGGRTA